MKTTKGLAIAFATVIVTACGGGDPTPGGSGGGTSAGATTSDLGGNPVTIKEATMGSSGGTFVQPGVLTADFPADALTDGTTVTSYADASEKMRGVLSIESSGFEFDTMDGKAVVLILGASPTNQDGSVRVQVKVSDALASAYTGGATPYLLYYAGQEADPDENGMDFAEIIETANAQFDTATQSVVADLPLSAFSAGAPAAAVVYAAAKSPVSKTNASVDTLKQPQAYSVNLDKEAPYSHPLGQDREFKIQGAFGEWRGQRAHGGMDLRTADSSGAGTELPLFSPAAGQISRIFATACVLKVTAKTMVCKTTGTTPMLSMVYQIPASTNHRASNFVFRHLKYGSISAAASGDCKTEINDRDAAPGAMDLSLSKCTVAAGAKIATTSDSGTDNKHLHVEVFSDIPGATDRTFFAKLNPLPFYSQLKIDMGSTGEISLTEKAAPVGPSLGRAFVAASQKVLIPGGNAGAAGFDGAGPSDVPVRFSLRDNNGGEILIRRAKGATRSADTFMPVTADWETKEPGSNGRMIYMQVSSDNPRVVGATEHAMRTDNAGARETDGVILVKPQAVGNATLKVELLYATAGPLSRGEWGLSTATPNGTPWPLDDFMLGSAAKRGTLATIDIPIEVTNGLGPSPGGFSNVSLTCKRNADGSSTLTGLYATDLNPGEQITAVAWSSEYFTGFTNPGTCSSPTYKFPDNRQFGLPGEYLGSDCVPTDGLTLHPVYYATCHNPLTGQPRKIWVTIKSGLSAALSAGGSVIVSFCRGTTPNLNGTGTPQVMRSLETQVACN